MLPFDEFKAVVKNTPLLSIDLIVRNSKGNILLGLRKNRPAKDFWFVPGGRIFKDESVARAISRISEIEIGLKIDVGDANFLGYFEHFYDENVSNEQFGTHYLVLAFELECSLDLSALPDLQHDGYRWRSVREIALDPEVHNYTKMYFDLEG